MGWQRLHLHQVRLLDPFVVAMLACAWQTEEEEEGEEEEGEKEGEGEEEVEDEEGKEKD